MYCSFLKDQRLHDPYERHETHNTLSSFITPYKKNPFPIKIKAVVALNGSLLLLFSEMEEQKGNKDYKF